MKNLNKNLLLTLVLITSNAFIGCGGGGSSSPGVGTTGSFEFTSSDSANIFTGTTRALDVDAVDPDGNSISYALSGTDADKFVIDSDGVILFKSAATAGTYHVKVTALAGGKSITQDITITVTTPVNHAPVITSSGVASANENQTNAMTITATDEDGDTLHYAISSGSDADKVSINPNDGVVTFNSAPDYESKSSYTFTVSVTDSIDTTTKDITINIVDIDEGHAPVITTPSIVHVNENQKSAVDVDATDVDGDTITYSLEGGVDIASFDINSTTGKVNFKVAPDYESKNSYAIIVGASDATTTTTKSITISIDDVQGGSNIVKTGQTIRYEFDDDGDLQMGLDKNFSKSGIYYTFLGFTVDERVVINETTNIEWQSSEYIKKANYTDAATYCNNLNYNNKEDWRLPRIDEFYDIADRGEENPAINSIFDTIKTDIGYWTQTEYKRSADKHYTFNFNKGNDATASNSSQKYVRCVRSNNLYIWNPFYKRFTRSGNILFGGDIITDNTTKLQWYDRVSRFSFPIIINNPSGTWQEAIQGCKDLTVDGKSDWRLPNINELLSIVDHSKSSGSAFYNIFETRSSGRYFSSTTNAGNSQAAWTVNFSDGQDIASVSKSLTQKYRCVRTLGD